MKATILQPEHAVAVRWLNYCERYGVTERISDGNVFRRHLAEAIEEGELDSSSVNHAETVAIAKERIASGRWPKTLARFCKLADGKPVKVATHRDGATYSFKGWSIRVYKRTINHRRGCGLRYSSTELSWVATHPELGRHKESYSDGGIRKAVEAINKG